MKSRRPISLASCSSLRSKGISFEKREGSKVRVVLRGIDRTRTDNRLYIDRSSDWSRSIQLSRRSRGLAGARARRVAMVTNVTPP